MESIVYDWYGIYNLDEFEALELPSLDVELYLEDIGLKSILISKGNLVSILYNGILLSVELNEKNPFEFEDHAVYLDEDNNIWLGIKNVD